MAYMRFFRLCLFKDRGSVGEGKASMLNSKGNGTSLGYLCCLWFVSAQTLIDFACCTLFASLGGRNREFES